MHQQRMLSALKISRIASGAKSRQMSNWEDSRLAALTFFSVECSEWAWRHCCKCWQHCNSNPQYNLWTHLHWTSPFLKIQHWRFTVFIHFLSLKTSEWAWLLCSLNFDGVRTKDLAPGISYLILSLGRMFWVGVVPLLSKIQRRQYPTEQPMFVSALDILSFINWSLKINHFTLPFCKLFWVGVASLLSWVYRSQINVPQSILYFLP